MPTLIIAIVSIVLLLVLHELGHFLTAKSLKIKVEEFGVGYPPRIFGKKIGETMYSLNWLPFGAFVKIPGPDGEGENLKDSENYEKRPAWQKASVLLGGVVSFWLIAAILLSVAFTMGVPSSVSDSETNLPNVKVQILSVSADSPAQLGGLKPGDVITGFEAAGDRTDIDTVLGVQDFAKSHQGQEVSILIKRGAEELNIPLALRSDSSKGILGISLVRTADQSYSLKEAPLMGIKATGSLTWQVITGWFGVLKSLISGGGLPVGVDFVGPVGIGSMLNDAAKIGASYFLQFIALLAIYLAVFNILPIPALDGGRILFLAIEKIKGSPINKKVEQKFNGAVFLIMLILMAFVTIKDITNLF
ncbi:MAG: site-2 protease family protein [Candidatus Paceibacterota bacterium]|jgi:regulator of sigma E protease